MRSTRTHSLTDGSVRARGPGVPGVALLLGGLLLTEVAGAGLPEMEEILTQRAREEWFQACPDSSTTGAACQARICGVDFDLDPGPGVVRVIRINGHDWDLHEVGNADLAVAAYLNRACNGAVGLTPSAFGHQLQLADDYRQWGRWWMQRGQAGAEPGEVLTLGAALEHGSHGTNVLSAPFGYAHSMSEDAFINVNGTVSGAFVPGAGYFAINALPSFGMLGGDRQFSWGLGGYAPLALGMVSYAPLEHSAANYTVGLGGIGVANARFGKALLSGGAVIEGRLSDPGAGHLPMNALVQINVPVSMADAYGSVAFAADPLGPGSVASSLRLGAGFGNWLFGYQLFIANEYVGHHLGAIHRQKLKRAELLTRPKPEPVATQEEEPETAAAGDAPVAAEPGED